MSLWDIKNKLYKKDQDPNLAAHVGSEFDPRQAEVDLNQSGKPQEKDVWSESAPIPVESKKKVLKIAVIAIISFLAILAIAIVIYFSGSFLFGQDRVIVAMEGPTETRSGKLLTYEITYENKNIIALKDAELRITHPENFKPEESLDYQEESPTVSLVKIGEIKGKSSGKIIYNGKSYAPKGTLAYLKTELKYKPSNFNSNFISKNQLGLNVTSTPLIIEVLAPQNLASGDALDYQISYKNTGADDFENIRVKVDFPDGFIFAKSNPNVSEGTNIWYIGHLSAGEGGAITISGKLQGERDVAKNFKAFVGVISQGQFVSYNEESVTTKIAASPLFITQTVNNSTNYFPNAGDKLRFEIKYKNEGDLGLKNLVVTEKLDSPILDYASIDFEGGGAYDTEKQLFVWKASDHKDLINMNPGQEGVIRFTINVRDLIPVNTVNDRDFVVSSIVKIDSPDIPTPINMNKIIAGNRLDMKLNSKLIMIREGFYKNDDIANAGPIPPVVGQATTYTIVLKAGNVSNDVTGGKMEIVLPTGVAATGKIYPPNAPLAYNERTNHLVWDLGTIKAGEGILSPFREVAFQIKVIPSIDQVGQSIDILQESIFSAKDSFTGENLIVKQGAKNIRLPEDATISSSGWNVAKKLPIW